MRKILSGKVIVAALMVMHGIFLIIIGLSAFFAGFVGIYDMSNGRVTPGSIVAVLGVFLSWIFLLGGIVSFLCAQGLWTWQRWAFCLTIAQQAHQSDRRGFHATAASVRSLAHCHEYACFRRHSPLCADSDRPSYALQQLILPWKAGQVSWPN